MRVHASAAEEYREAVLLRLRIEVTNQQLVVRLGPFQRTIDAFTIRSVRPERYRP